LTPTADLIRIDPIKDRVLSLAIRDGADHCVKTWDDYPAVKCLIDLQPSGGLRIPVQSRDDRHVLSPSHPPGDEIALIVMAMEHVGPEPLDDLRDLPEHPKVEPPPIHNVPTGSPQRLMPEKGTALRTMGDDQAHSDFKVGQSWQQHPQNRLRATVTTATAQVQNSQAGRELPVIHLY
jgi:hypothetical protein